MLLRRLQSVEQLNEVVRHRPDLRLMPAVAGVWLTAALAILWPLRQVMIAAIVLGIALMSAVVGRKLRRRRTPHRVAGTTLALATACMVAVLIAIALQLHLRASSPITELSRQHQDLSLTLEVSSVPRLLTAGQGPPQLIFEAVVLHATANARSATGRLTIVVLAKPSWSGVHQGDRVTTAGVLAAPRPGSREAAVLHPSTIPLAVTPGRDESQQLITAMRTSWIAAARQVWGETSPDTAGLLPGMVMGDRSGTTASLDEAMKTVGLTHLTAVSGANCTLILASLMLVLRTAKVSRLLAVPLALLGLMGFVLLVGPDPSVLRAAVMGSIGAMAILGGRPKRTGALLSLAILVLLMADPWLARDFAFILSVLATLGLHLVGQRCVVWLQALLPVWLAQAMAIPLAAQLFCSPVIVLLQARLTVYTIPANMLAAPLIALVTMVGTLGLVLAAVVPPVAALCAAVSGVGAWWVALVARFMSGLPAASLPWPEGVQGMVLMALLNVLVLLLLLAVVEREHSRLLARRLVRYLPDRWRHRYGFLVVAVMAAGLTVWWTAAVRQL